MNKVEILEVVIKMRNDWTKAFDGNVFFYYYCGAGFCTWLCERFSINDSLILMELEKDLFGIKKAYWYPTFNRLGKEGLIPRIDHLNRTIARLENELKTNCNE